jgi:hypothetical protein
VLTLLYRPVTHINGEDLFNLGQFAEDTNPVIVRTDFGTIANATTTPSF